MVVRFLHHWALWCLYPQCFMFIGLSIRTATLSLSSLSWELFETLSLYHSGALLASGVGWMVILPRVLSSRASMLGFSDCNFTWKSEEKQHIQNKKKKTTCEGESIGCRYRGHISAKFSWKERNRQREGTCRNAICSHWDSFQLPWRWGEDVMWRSLPACPTCPGWPQPGQSPTCWSCPPPSCSRLSDHRGKTLSSGLPIPQPRTTYDFSHH